jgi:hypothetical protein
MLPALRLQRRAGTSTLDQILCFTAANALGNTSSQVSFNIYAAVLQQFIGYANDF